uniref:Natural killer cell receptor 2B4 immunoglobulin domain-containing protein n=1 Tax=Calidris pygmaea TaxID=425635 RepID=A0A8C3PN10_9CHAR
VYYKGGPSHPLQVLNSLQGAGCQEQAVAAGGELRLVPEKPPQGWVKVEWRVRLDTGDQHRILTADKSKTPQFSSGPFLGRAFFQPENLSLQIPQVTTADSGLYRAEFVGKKGSVTSLFFCVSVWEPLAQPFLETRILHQEQDRCNLSLLCTVPGATNVSYSWSCTGGQPGALGHQSQLDLQVLGVSAPTVCLCNATNLVSWSKATTDVTAVCLSMGPGLCEKWGDLVQFGPFPPGSSSHTSPSLYRRVGMHQSHKCRQPPRGGQGMCRPRPPNPRPQLLSPFAGSSWSYCSVKGMLCLLVLGSLGTAVAITHLLIRQRGPPSHGAGTG